MHYDTQLLQYCVDYKHVVHTQGSLMGGIVTQELHTPNVQSVFMKPIKVVVTPSNKGYEANVSTGQTVGSVGRPMT